MLYGGSLVLIVGRTHLFCDFCTLSPRHPQNSDVGQHQAQYHHSMGICTAVFAWFCYEDNANYYGQDPCQSYDHEKMLSWDAQKMRKRSSQSLYSVISNYNEVRENYMKADESDDLECCAVAVVSFAVAKIVDVHWLRNHTVYEVCGC